MRVLNDEEILIWARENGCFYDAVSATGKRIGAQAQHDSDMKEFVEWGNERCPHPSTFDGQRLTKKKNCPECWQALQAEQV